MNFKESKAIYLQIADRICDEILLGQFAEEERIPSVREYATIVEVNANTVMRSFDYLQSQNIIYNKRGIGYFVSPARSFSRSAESWACSFSLSPSVAEISAGMWAAFSLSL